MTHYLVNKSTLKGEISIPPSKSHTLRAILFGALGNGKTTIHNYLPSNDTDAMIHACRLLGARLEVSPQLIEIYGVNGKIRYSEDVIHSGNSGIILRFCTAIGALSHHPMVITGDHSIRHHRPMKPLIEGLTQLGVSVKSMRGDDLAPIIVHGPLKSGKAVISGEDSQPVSALLIAAAFAEGPIEIHVKNAGEKPWIALTLSWFDRLGIPYTNHDFERYVIPGNSQYEGFDYTVPGDLSSAAFPIAAALVTRSELTLKNVDMNDLQGDKELIQIFQKMGAQIEIDDVNKALHVKKSGLLKGIKVDINNFVDAITTLAVVASVAEGETHIFNAAIAKTKECDRIQCVTKELRKMGVNISETADGLIIQNSSLKGAQLDSYHDHRMAMSLAIAGLAAEGETKIGPVECVSKTFPQFLSKFQGLGALIKEIS